MEESLRSACNEIINSIGLKLMIRQEPVKPDQYKAGTETKFLTNQKIGNMAISRKARHSSQAFSLITKV